MGLAKAMDFVDEEQCSLATARQIVTSLVEQLPQLLHAAGHGRKLSELHLAFGSQQSRQRRFPRAGRTIEDHRAQPIGG